MVDWEFLRRQNRTQTEFVETGSVLFSSEPSENQIYRKTATALIQLSKEGGVVRVSEDTSWSVVGTSLQTGVSTGKHRCSPPTTCSSWELTVHQLYLLSDISDPIIRNQRAAADLCVTLCCFLCTDYFCWINPWCLCGKWILWCGCRKTIKLQSSLCERVYAWGGIRGRSEEEESRRWQKQQKHSITKKLLMGFIQEEKT